MIQVENLVKKYGLHTAVEHLSFKVEKGQIYGFLGPNGAGKSTTMNIMTGYIAANSGTVKINGYDILKEPEMAKRCIGYLPEVPPLYTDMTVREYLMFVAELKKVGRRKRAEHVEEIIEKLQLSEVQERLIRNLSKGYKQRVGLAQALTGYPDVLILDEPMNALDNNGVEDIRMVTLVITSASREALQASQIPCSLFRFHCGTTYHHVLLYITRYLLDPPAPPRSHSLYRQKTAGQRMVVRL